MKPEELARILFRLYRLEVLVTRLFNHKYRADSEIMISDMRREVDGWYYEAEEDFVTEAKRILGVTE